MLLLFLGNADSNNYGFFNIKLSYDNYMDFLNLVFITICVPGRVLLGSWLFSHVCNLTNTRVNEPLINIPPPPWTRGVRAPLLKIR